MQGPEVRAVPALCRVACHRAEVVEVPGGVQAVVIMVADDGDGASLSPSPRRIVGPHEVGVCRAAVGVVTNGKHVSSRVGVEERRCGESSGQVEAKTVGDIAGSHQNHISGL